MYHPKIRKLPSKNRILECIFRRASIARTNIAEDVDITPATVTLTANGLIADGAVREPGETDSGEGSSGGKRILIDMVPNYVYSTDVEFTQEALVAYVTDSERICICQSERPFDESLPPHITGEIIEQIQNFLDSCQLPPERIIGIGIAVPGHMDKKSRHFISNHMVRQSFNSDAIRRAFPYPMVMENNAHCMTLAQYLFSPGSSPENFSFFHIGLGMFCANVTDGEPSLGNSYVPDEVGHIIVKAGGQPCEYGKYGYLRAVASERWLLKYARLLYQSTADTILHNMVDAPEELIIQHITTAYSTGDVTIDRYITDTLKYLGTSISNVAILMNPGKIFLHGQLFQNEDIRRGLTNIVERQLLFMDSKYVSNTEILPYRQTDGAIGASALSVLHSFI